MSEAEIFQLAKSRGVKYHYENGSWVVTHPKSAVAWEIRGGGSLYFYLKWLIIHL